MSSEHGKIKYKMS